MQEGRVGGYQSPIKHTIAFGVVYSWHARATRNDPIQTSCLSIHSHHSCGRHAIMRESLPPLLSRGSLDMR